MNNCRFITLNKTCFKTSSSRNFDFHLSPLSLEPRRDGLEGRQISQAQSGSKLPLRAIGNRDGRIGKAPLPMAFGEVDKNSQTSTIGSLPAVTIEVTPASPKQLRQNTLRTPSPCKQIVQVEIHWRSEWFPNLKLYSLADKIKTTLMLESTIVFLNHKISW